MPIYEFKCNGCKKISEFMKENDFNEIYIVQDYQKIDRVIYGVKK